MWVKVAYQPCWPARGWQMSYQRQICKVKDSPSCENCSGMFTLSSIADRRSIGLVVMACCSIKYIRGQNSPFGLGSVCSLSLGYYPSLSLGYYPD